MNPAVPNVFGRLHKWAARQDENFLTESLAVLIEYLLRFAPESGTRIVSLLTDGFIDLTADESHLIGIETQLELVTGRPDLEIRTSKRLVWVEVKVESEVRAGQLEGYRYLLKRAGVESTRLVLLTRYAMSRDAKHERPDAAIRWFEIANWLEDESERIEGKNSVAGFLASQFLEFLESRNMTLSQVGKYLPDGIKALSNLMNMLHEAATGLGLSPKKDGGWDYMALELDGRKYRVAVDYSEPEKLWFGTRAKIDERAAESLPDGEPVSAWKQGAVSWWRGVELDSEAVHFYSRSKMSQMQWLESFLAESLALAKSIETKDQPASIEPVTDESDDL